MPPFTAFMIPSNVVKYIVVILANVCLHFFPELEAHCREEKEMEENESQPRQDRRANPDHVILCFSEGRACSLRMPLLSVVHTAAWKEEAEN